MFQKGFFDAATFSPWNHASKFALHTHPIKMIEDWWPVMPLQELPEASCLFLYLKITWRSSYFILLSYKNHVMLHNTIHGEWWNIFFSNIGFLKWHHNKSWNPVSFLVLTPDQLSGSNGNFEAWFSGWKVVESKNYFADIYLCFTEIPKPQEPFKLYIQV